MQSYLLPLLAATLPRAGVGLCLFQPILLTLEGGDQASSAVAQAAESRLQASQWAVGAVGQQNEGTLKGDSATFSQVTCLAAATRAPSSGRDGLPVAASRHSDPSCLVRSMPARLNEQDAFSLALRSILHTDVHKNCNCVTAPKPRIVCSNSSSPTCSMPPHAARSSQKTPLGLCHLRLPDQLSEALH